MDLTAGEDESIARRFGIQEVDFIVFGGIVAVDEFVDIVAHFSGEHVEEEAFRLGSANVY